MRWEAPHGTRNLPSWHRYHAGSSGCPGVPLGAAPSQWYSGLSGLHPSRSNRYYCRSPQKFPSTRKDELQPQAKRKNMMSSMSGSKRNKRDEKKKNFVRKSIETKKSQHARTPKRNENSMVRHVKKICPTDRVPTCQAERTPSRTENRKTKSQLQ